MLRTEPVPDTRASRKELSETPDEKEYVHDPKEQGKAEFTTGPPLAVLTKSPGRMDDRRIIPLHFKRLVLIAIPMQVDKEFRLCPVSLTFHSTELPFPQRRLCRKAAKHNGHLHGHEHAEQAQDDDKQHEDHCDGLPGKEKADRCHKDRVRRQIIRKQAVVVPDARCPEFEKILVRSLQVSLVHARLSETSGPSVD